MIQDDRSIFITRGDYDAFDIAFKNEQGELVPLEEGDKLILTVKQNVYSNTILLRKEVTEFTDGVALFTFYPEDTKHLDFVNYVYDIEYQGGTGFIKTIIRENVFTVGTEVTDE